MKDDKLQEILELLPYSIRYSGEIEELLDYAKEQAEQVQYWSDIARWQNDEKFKLDQHCLKLEQQNKRYREALEFYADEGTYEVIETSPPTDEYQQPIEPVFKTVPIIYYDKGKKARRALECEE